MTELTKDQIKDIIQWDIKNWQQALLYWETKVDWGNTKTCLELGSREGGLSLWVALKNKKVICSDFGDVKLTAGKLHEKYKVSSLIEYENIDATNIPYENQFDLIMFKSIIGGIGRNNDKEKQKTVFNQIYKALKPKGKLIFAENLIASPMHQLLRKANDWSKYWGYVSLTDLKNSYLSDFSSFEVKSGGFLGVLGRNESQRDFLASIDIGLLNKIFPDNWKYISYGIAEK